MSGATVNLAFELTPGGLKEAQAELDRIRELFERRGAVDLGEQPAGEIVYLECRGRMSRELLETLPDRKEDALTFTELAERMSADDKGSKRKGPQVRAAYRNVKRVEKRLLETGRISDDVIQVDYESYGDEGANRYYLRPEDRTAIHELGERAADN